MWENCSCSCDFDFEVEVTRIDILRAAKEHICVECGEPIREGEEFEMAWSYDHYECRFHKGYKTCIPCMRIRNDRCPCYLIGALRDEIRDREGFDYVTGEDWT